MAKSGGVTITMNLTGLGGTHIITPKLFSDGELRAMQYGLFLTDGSVNKRGYPEMGTNQLWQVVAWLVASPGKNHVHIRGMGINCDDVRATWYLRANDHRGRVRG
ncbi:hypothetical protein [Vulcanisaeta distributa]|uniref:hypothetical protein n=1 Tax=Vulcanisaeta distributa TaxID=164451 RepID=UPI0006CFCA50|nr:hypothetical protein [Vulcanisaeta distributa]